MTKQKPLTNTEKLVLMQDISRSCDLELGDAPCHPDEQRNTEAQAYLLMCDILDAPSAELQGEIVTIRYHVSDLGADGLVKYYSLSQCWNKEHFESKYLLRKPEECQDGETEERLMVLLPVKEDEKKLE